VALWWLGQAGFLLESASVRILIDPYLSDSLAIKYRGTARPHIRMRPAPIAPADLADIDIVLASHGHGDHLDPMTIGPLASANPGCVFVVPASCAAKALERGVPRERLVEANAFAPLQVAGIAIHPIPSAHEELSLDDHGRLAALGFVIELGALAIYHPGDCAPYPGLADNLSRFAVDLALLPVNGRDAERAAAGILGNFSLDEAVALAEDRGFGAAIGHHFGMFDFNTIDEAAARRRLDSRSGAPPFLLAEEGLRYELKR
jgi:L-ascorbate metabolism protein UlaG (beta-lactamase superfamily)